MRYYDFDKTAARRAFQKRTYLFFGLLFGAILGFPILSYLFRLIGIEGALAFIIVPWMLACFGVAIWRTCWRCPRCHKYFFQNGGTAMLSPCTACIAVSVPMS